MSMLYCDVPCFISVYLEVININVVNICKCLTSHNTPLPTSDLIKINWSVAPNRACHGIQFDILDGYIYIYAVNII